MTHPGALDHGICNIISSFSPYCTVRSVLLSGVPRRARVTRRRTSPAARHFTLAGRAPKCQGLQVVNSVPEVTDKSQRMVVPWTSFGVVERQHEQDLQKTQRIHGQIHTARTLRELACPPVWKSSVLGVQWSLADWPCSGNRAHLQHRMQAISSSHTFSLGPCKKARLYWLKKANMMGPVSMSILIRTETVFSIAMPNFKVKLQNAVAVARLGATCGLATLSQLKRME